MAPTAVLVQPGASGLSLALAQLDDIVHLFLAVECETRETCNVDSLFSALFDF